MPKRSKPTPCDRLWRSVTSIDMFGERIYLNLDGKESFDTCCGSLCTLIILCVVALFALFQVRLYQSQWTEVPILSTYVKKDFFNNAPVEVRQDVHNFYFAIAITGKQEFANHTTEAFEKAGGSISLRYTISGGPESGKVFNIPMAPCSDFSFYRPSGVKSLDRTAAAHMEVSQFFCPSAFDLSFYGSSDDTLKKTLFVDIKSKNNEYLEGKHVAMLINTRDIEFSDEYENVQLKNYT